MKLGPGVSILTGLILLTLVPPSHAAGLKARLTAEVAGPLLETVPIRLKLTIKNEGDAPLTYWWGGPGRYPSADCFSVVVKDGQGQSRTLPLHNGQYVQGSGVGKQIETSETLPAVCDPLPPGRYTLTVSCSSRGYLADGKTIEHWPAMQSAPVSVEVKQDLKAASAAEQDLMREAKNDPFARHVACTYGIDPEVRTWLEQLSDPSPDIARAAVGRLQHVLRLPTGVDSLLNRGARRACERKAGLPDQALLVIISELASRQPTDENLDTVLVIARFSPDLYASAAAIGDLAKFPQKQAADRLGELATDKDPNHCWPAIGALAARHDRRALGQLLEAAKDQNPGRRSFAISALAGLRSDPAAHDALKAALKDPDAAVRQTAERVLKAE